MFLVLAGGLLAFEAALPTQYYGKSVCPDIAGFYPIDLSVVSSLYPVGAPEFTVPQVIVAPGSTARINVTYTGATDNQTLPINPYYSSNQNFTLLDSFIGFLDQDQSTNSTGVTITRGPLVFHSNDTASQLFTITAALTANWATYPVGPVGCGFDQGGFLLTVGYLPYWQPVFWITQPATDIACIAIAALIVALVAGSVRLIHRIGKIEIG